MAKCMLCRIEIADGCNICPVCSDLKEKAKCPQCGRKVFIPLKGWRDHYDIDVMCSDMGHWVGKLSECMPEDWHDDWM
jgi:hypothetical protein